MYEEYQNLATINDSSHDNDWCMGNIRTLPQSTIAVMTMTDVWGISGLCHTQRWQPLQWLMYGEYKNLASINDSSHDNDWCMGKIKTLPQSTIAAMTMTDVWGIIEPCPNQRWQPWQWLMYGEYQNLATINDSSHDNDWCMRNIRT